MEFIDYNNKKIPIAYRLDGNCKTASKNKQIRNQIKFNKMARLASRIDEIESKMWNIVENKKIDQKKYAYSILLMLHTGIRSGNEDSAEGYVCNVKSSDLFGQTIQTYGITTLKKEHIIFEESIMRISFLGKKAVEQDIIVNHQKLIEWGKFFIENSPEEKWLNIEQSDLRKFIRKNFGRAFYIKDFRTLRANLTAGEAAVEVMNRKELPKSNKEMNEEIKSISRIVSEQLGNTPAICKTAYINPEIFDWLAKNRFPKFLEKPKKKKRQTKKKKNEQKIATLHS